MVHLALVALQRPPEFRRWQARAERLLRIVPARHDTCETRPERHSTTRPHRPPGIFPAMPRDTDEWPPQTLNRRQTAAISASHLPAAADPGSRNSPPALLPAIDSAAQVSPKPAN